MVVVPDDRPARSAYPVLARPSIPARPIAAAILPPLALLAFTALVFFGELGGGPIFYGRDTTVFYYPLTEWMVGELRTGRLPLWIPLIFGGYPLLADGEVGPLYPLHVAFLAPVAFEAAYAGLRALHYAIAALGLYALARTLGAGPLGAVVGGLAFGYGSFMVGHLQHDNILRSAVWLPWLLLAAERALASAGPRRALWIAAGALVLALQCLGIHIQPVLLSLLALGLYLVVGPLGPPSPPGPHLGEGIGGVGRGRGKGRGNRAPTGLWGWGAFLLARARIGAGIVGLGLGLAAMQLLPLYGLGQRSMRPSLVTYDYATSYAVSPPQLLTLLFPYMFHFDAESSWALWSPHESTLYVGVAPFLLALVAVGFIRTRAVLFFTGLAAASLILCLGDYFPVKAYTVIWNLPGFAYLRAPARFSLVFELAVACLAALAVEWIARRARAGTAPRGLGRLLVGLALTSAGLALALQGLRWWLQHEPAPALELFRVGLQTSKENWLLGPWHVYYGLLEFARPSSFHTALGLGLLAVVPLILRSWLTSSRHERWWRFALLGLVAGDLWLFATAFHARADPQALVPASPALGHLVGQPGPGWLFVEPDLNRPLGANQLVRHGLPTVNGYSSLEPRSFSEYWWGIVTQDNVLLDLFNVRYVLAPRRPPAGQRTFEGTIYHPSDRLLSGVAGNPAGVEEFRAGPIRAVGVTVVAAVEQLGEVRDGTPVAELTLVGTDGETRVLPLRAGLDVGEHRAAEPGRPTAGYVGPRVVWAGTSFTPNGRGGVPVRLYGAHLPVYPPIEVAAVSVRVLPTSGRLHLHGLGLRDAEGAVSSLRPSDRAKYRLLYADQDVLLLENGAAWPRAFVVGGAVASEPSTPLPDQLLGRPWDPARQVVVEGAIDGPAGEAGAPAAGRAELITYSPGRATVRAELDAPGYLVLSDRYDPGWRAWADGRELTIRRANGIQQAVALPAGAHNVTFAYDPWWVKLGFAVTGASASAWLVLVALALRAISSRVAGAAEADVVMAGGGRPR